jgi:hypothetical protein
MSMTSATESAREALRREHDVRLVTPEEEGVSAEHLPAGVYGFTSSPALASPLFALRKFRNFEVHRLASGVCAIGFVTPANAAALAHAQDDTVAVQLYPDAEGDAAVIVSVSYDRVVQHRQYAVRNAEAIHLHIRPAHAVTPGRPTRHAGM